MTTILTKPDTPAKPATAGWLSRGQTRLGAPAVGQWYDRVVVALVGWIVAGAYLDGWAHVHLNALETFFTPWHAVMYSGLAVTLTWLAGTFVRHWWLGHHWRTAMPRGYGLSLIGALLFMVGGISDMFWHLAFGIEVGFEPLLSPPHLTLGVGAGLMLTGPIRAAWWQADATPGRAVWSTHWPMLVSVAYLLAIFSFFSANYHPLGETVAAQAWLPTWANRGARRAIASAGYLGILLHITVLMSVMMVTMRRWRLPFGAFTMCLGLHATLMALMVEGEQQPGVLAMTLIGVGVGLGVDLVGRRFELSPLRVNTFRLFAFGLPVTLYTTYFLALWLSGGVWWSVHVAVGIIFEAGIVGWLLSFLVAPPQQSVVQAPTS